MKIGVKHPTQPTTIHPPNTPTPAHRIKPKRGQTRCDGKADTWVHKQDENDVKNETEQPQRRSHDLSG